ncbi:MAG: holo-ACP synthase [Chloroflexi bacterium]|nr:holo-ACP synthase [Chloroflexota bacterium]
MDHAVGVDVIEIHRIQRAVARWGERFVKRIYTPAELAFCRQRVQELAVRFAAKEAVMKALGTGRRGVGWREIEVLNDQRGKPVLRLWGGAQARAQEIGLSQVDLSLSHSRDLAVASVVGATNESGHR